MRSIIISACVPLALLSCSIDTNRNVGATPTITEANDGSIVTARTGELLSVCLNENPSTGFRWTIEGELTLFDIEDNSYTASSTNVGSGGRECWRLRAKQAGQETIAFRLWRQWEGDKSIVKRFQFKANVSPR